MHIHVQPCRKDSIRKSDSTSRSIRQTNVLFPIRQVGLSIENSVHRSSGRAHIDVCRFDRFVRMDNFADYPAEEFVDPTKSMLREG